MPLWAAESPWALQAAEKLDPEGDRGFNPRVRPIESTGFSPGGRFSGISPENQAFFRSLFSPCGITSGSMLMRMLVRFLCGLRQRMRRHGHHQAAMLHAFEADQPIGKLFHMSRFSMHDQHFQAGIVVQVRMAGGDH